MFLEVTGNSKRKTLKTFVPITSKNSASGRSYLSSLCPQSLCISNDGYGTKESFPLTNSNQPSVFWSIDENETIKRGAT
jgi:hypothetical protein